MELQRLEILISNARTARDSVKTDWGRNYWDCVIRALIRQTNCLTK